MTMKNAIDVLEYNVLVLTSTYKDTALYTYVSNKKLELGTIVNVPWGDRISLGIVYSPRDNNQTQSNHINIREITSATDIVLPQYIAAAILWIASYYQVPVLFISKIFLSKSLKLGETKSSLRLKYETKTFSPNNLIKPIELSQKQTTIANSIIDSPELSHLIFAVTGSGKTHIYMRLIENMLFQKKSTLLLVPEISLIAPITAKIKQYFSGDIINYSSELSSTKKTELWYRIYNNQDPLLIIGTRSSLNLPISNLGLIILDEEHDSSYYHGQYPRYSAKLLAAFIGKFLKIKVVLGSATPDINSLFWAQKGHIKLHRLEQRALGKITNNITIIKQEDLLDCSKELINKIRLVAQTGKKTLYLINQRGNYRRLYCHDCAYVFNCHNCGSALIWHSDNSILLCHNCGLSSKAYHSCPNCHKHNLVFYGQGTKEIEKNFKSSLPELNIIRLDRDESMPKRSMIVSEIIKGNFDLLIGTQIISKGLDLGDIGLIVIDAQSLLANQDFLAEEKFVQIVIQIIGRGGRHSADPYEVIILGGDSANVALGSIINEQYELFFQKENYLRQKYNFPPHSYLLLLTINGKDENKVRSKAYKLMNEYQWGQSLSIEPPYKRYYKANGKIQYSILVKAKKRVDLITVAQDISHMPGWQIDLDPITID